MRRVLLLFFCLLVPLISAAEQKRFTVGPMVNRLESLGKGLLDDGVSYGLRMGYNIDEHLAVELGYDYLSDFTLLTVPGEQTTNGHQIMANFLYNVKDDNGFIPYMMAGLGAEKYDNSGGGLESGGIAAIGLGAHFLIHEPISLRLEFKDIVRFSDAGHTFSWTFGLEYSFGKMERYVEEDAFSFAYYKIKESEDRALIASRASAKPEKRDKYRSYRSERDASYRAGRTEKAARERIRTAASQPVRAAKISTLPALSASAVSETIPKVSVKVDGMRSGVKSKASKTESKAESKPHKRAGGEVYDIDIENTAGGIAEKGRYTDGREKRSLPEAEETEPKAAETGVVKVSKAAHKEKAPSSSAGALSAAVAAGGAADAGVSLKGRSVDVSKRESNPKNVSSDEADCARDFDGDSVPDCKDRCKGTPKGWIVDSDGCATAISMLVNFEFDSTALNERARERIGELAEYLLKNRNIRVTIEGHTDSIGSDSYNLALSKRRALKVKSALVDLGVASERIDIRGYGESRPIASNETAAGRAENRRADALIIRLSI